MMRKGYHWTMTPQMLAHSERLGEVERSFVVPLANKLLSIGGKYVAYPPTYGSACEKGTEHILSAFINRVLNEGKLFESSNACIFEGRVGRVTMPRPRQCHNNTSRLFEAGKIARMGSGWSLKPNEECWHRHSWGISQDGKVWETTPPTRLCFGCTFDDPDIFVGVTAFV